MDYILFHSQYSPSSKKLFEDFPALIEKGICVDSNLMRAQVKKLHIVCVPTMIIILNNKIVDRIVGYEKIYNWVMITLYRTNQFQPAQQPNTDTPPVQQSQPQRQPDIPQDEPVEYDKPAQQTNLDDLILVDEPPSNLSARTEPKVQTGISGSTLQLAEALKKERDNDLETNNKKRMI